MTPPKLFLRFFRWFCHPKLLKHIEGDLMELYYERVKEVGRRKADRKFIIDVFVALSTGDYWSNRKISDFKHVQYV